MHAIVAMDVEALRALDKLVRNGLRGIHPLFSNRMIQEAFSEAVPDMPLTQSDVLDRVVTVLADLLHREDLGERQEYIESLDPAFRGHLVRMYFDHLDRVQAGGPGLEDLN